MNVKDILEIITKINKDRFNILPMQEALPNHQKKY
jgi:hypothetical protein